MKNLTKIASLIFLMGITACGSSEKNKSDKDSNDKSDKEIVGITPATTKVSGDLGQCFTVVNRTYKPTGDYMKVITVELTRNSEPLPFDEKFGEINSYAVSGSDDMIRVGFGIEFLDKDGNIVGKTPATDGGYSHKEPVELAKLKSGETGSIRFIFPTDAEEISSFRITSSSENYKGWGTTSPSTSEPDISKEIEKAKKEYQDAYNAAKKEYDDAYNEAKKQYEDAYNETSRRLGY